MPSFFCYHLKFGLNKDIVFLENAESAGSLKNEEDGKTLSI